MKKVLLQVVAFTALLGCEQLAAPVANVNFVSVEQEREIGAQFAQGVESEQKVLRDPAVNDYVAGLGRRLEGTIDRREFPYTFRVVDDPSVNAFNIGGGYIYVHTGLIKTATTEGQLASVLAHEMGHQIHRHVAKMISRQQLFQTLAQVAAGQNASQWVQLGASLGLTTGQMYFGREAERQADSEMVPILVRASYDPREALAMFEILQKLNQTQPSRVGALFSSHPPTSERIENVERTIASRSLPPDLHRDSRAFQEIRRRLLGQ